MKIYIICIAFVIIILFSLKWLFIALFFPSQVANVKRKNIKKKTGKRVWYLYFLSAPYVIWERNIMRGGWQRYMLFQIGLVPSLHLRKWVYKCLGAHIEHDVVFHFKTELRSPENLFVGGVL